MAVSQPRFTRSPTIPAILAVAAAFLSGMAAQTWAGDGDGGHGRSPKVLYIWAGDATKQNPDFLAVIDFNPNSQHYGTVIQTVPLPFAELGAGSRGNEPHHIGLSADKRILGCGGLLSLLGMGSGQVFGPPQNGVFFFDVTSPKRPRFIKAAGTLKSTIVDDFLPTPEGGFLITMMGSANGGTPGRVAEFNRNLDLVQEWPDDENLTRARQDNPGFNPHGISARPEINLMFTSDFVDPASTLLAVNPGAPPAFRSSIRVWDYKSRRIIKTITIPNDAAPLPGIGSMDVKLIPGDPGGRGFTAGMFDGLVYLIDPGAGTATPVFDCDTLIPPPITPVPGGMIQILAVSSNGRRLFFCLLQAGFVGMLDISQPGHPTQFGGIVQLGAGAGPHDILLTDDDKRLVVTDYFLSEDYNRVPFGQVLVDGDHKVHVMNVGPNGLALDPRFDLDFNRDFGPIQGRPHGIAAK
jgi:selenium-binding protein 1